MRSQYQNQVSCLVAKTTMCDRGLSYSYKLKKVISYSYKSELLFWMPQNQKKTINS